MDPVNQRKKKESLIGKTFDGRFEVTGFLGEGGMGRIYLARQRDMHDREVALKVLHAHLGHENEVTARFEREMLAAAKIEHPNSVRVYECGEAEGRLYLVMEFVDGDSLGELLLDEAPFPPERVARMGRQIAAALAAAHSKGIIHRDLKPDNVMVADAPGQKDVVKVCDFGLARFVEGGDGEEGDENEDFKTAVGVRVGTPHYMPPEYITEFATDHRGDIYALGVLMYEMATGAPPFDGRPYEVMDQHVSAKPVPPSQRNPAVPEWLDDVILHLLEKRPADRPQVAEEVIVKLERERNRPDAPDEDERPTRRLAAPPAKRSGPSPLLMGAVAFGVVLLLGFGVALCGGAAALLLL